MTLKILFGGAPLLSRGYGAGRSVAWYLGWRLRRG
jgi:hypothetical protein